MFKKSLKNFDVVNIDLKSLKRDVKEGKNIEIAGKTFNLVPNDLRAEDSSTFITDSNGTYQSKKEAVITYKGADDNFTRLTVTDKGVDGIVNNANPFYLKTENGETLIYREKDILSKTSCSIDKHIESKAKFSAENRSNSTQKVINIATEADYLWVTQAGSVAAATTEILSILNQVDAIYQRDLNLTLRIGFQHFWNTQDPLTLASLELLLEDYKNYWNANYPHTTYPRSVAHMFSGKLGGAGISYGNFIGRYTPYAYSLNGRGGSLNALITSHEIGHGLGGQHVNATQNCANTIMNPVGSYLCQEFCSYSKAQISNYVASNAGGFPDSGTATTNPTTTPIPAPIPVAIPKLATVSTATSGSNITVTWSGVSSPSPADWVGIFPVGAEVFGYTDYIYTGSGTKSFNTTARSSGTLQMPAPNTPGTYELRLNRNNGGTLVVKSTIFTVTAPAPTPTPTPSTGTTITASTPVGTSFTLTWSGVTNATAADWVGIFYVGATNYLGYFYTGTGTSSYSSVIRSSGSEPMTISAPGTYELRLCSNNTFTLLAKTVVIIG